MFYIPAEKIDSLFEVIGEKQPLYLPADTTEGRADFKKWEKGVKLSSFQRQNILSAMKCMERKSKLQTQEKTLKTL